MDFTYSNPLVRRTARLIHALSSDLRRIEQGVAPNGDDLRNAPIIDDWLLTYRIEPAVMGTVHGHPLVADGPVTTSGLFLLDVDRGYARTLSRFYKLGRPRSGGR